LSASRFDFDPDQPYRDQPFEAQAPEPEEHERLWLSTRILVAIAAVIGVLAIASAVGVLVFTGRDGKLGEAAIVSDPPASDTAASTEPAPSAPAPGTESATPSAAATPSPTRSGPTTQTAAIATAEAEVLTLVNRERARVGCAALAADSRLATAAGRHSADMARRGYFSHTTPEGVTFSMRITNAGYRWSLVGENIARGQRTPAAVMQAWMTSPGHRANILNCRFRHLGVGLAYDPRRVPYWTQDFGTPLR
jgi:uncharacterized protein YkwD